MTDECKPPTKTVVTTVRSRGVEIRLGDGTTIRVHRSNVPGKGKRTTVRVTGPHEFEIAAIER